MSLVKDLHNNVVVKRAISPQNPGSGNTAIVSQIIDMQGFRGLEFFVALGSLSDSDVTFTVLIEDGDNSSLTDNAAVADAELLGTEAGGTFQFDDDNEVRKFGYVGAKRYVRLTITPANNTGDTFISAVAVQLPNVLPQTDQTA